MNKGIVKVYTNKDCPRCMMTEHLLRMNHIKFTKVFLKGHPKMRRQFKNKGYNSAPVVVVNNANKQYSWSGFQPSKIMKLTK